MTSKIANISQLLAGFDQVDDDCGLMSKARCVDLCLAASLVAGAACDGRTSHPHENPDPSVAGEQDDDAASARAFGTDAPTRKVAVAGVEPQLKEIEEQIAAGKLDEAKAKAEAWRKEAPQSADAAYAVGLVASHQGEYAAAKSDFEKAIKLSPEHAFAHAALARVLAYSEHDFVSALEHARIAANANAKWAQGQALYGALLLETGAPSQAVGHLESARKLEPNHPDTAFSLARAYAATGRLDKGLESARTGIGLQPGIEGLDIRMLAGRLLCASGDFDQAQEMFESAYKLAPELSDLRLASARAFLQYRAPEYAETAIEPLQKTLGDSVPLLVTQGRIQAARGKIDGKGGALALYDQALARDSSVLAPHLYAVEALVGASRCEAARQRVSKIPAALAASPSMDRVRDLVSTCKK